MANKLTFGLGLGVGYVLGTKAGREKFDQLVNSSRHAWNSETVQNAKDAARCQATKLYDEGKHALNDRLSKHEHIGRKPDETLAPGKPPPGPRALARRHREVALENQGGLVVPLHSQSPLHQQHHPLNLFRPDHVWMGRTGSGEAVGGG